MNTSPKRCALRTYLTRWISAIVLLASVGINSVQAEEIISESSVADLQTSMNYIWVMMAAALVFIMQGGFMCVEAGMARAKNSINVSLKNMADFMLSIGGFWLFGFGLMFGTSYMGFIGTDHYSINVTDNAWVCAFFVFQAVFCGTAATIDSGAVAERTKFSTYLFLSFTTSALIYPIFGHWAWGSLLNGESQGWLESLGFIDFAGSTVVHSVGAWVALAGVIIIGPRIGKIGDNGKVKKIPAHSLPLTFLGVFILFFGWFGFNCGSTLEASPSIAAIAMTTLISGCFGGLSATAISWILSEEKRPEPEMIANGMLGGLVGITAGCASVDAIGAALIGLISGVVVYASTWLIEQKWKLDDVVGAIPVHGFCGAWGTIAVALFMSEASLAEAGVTRWEQLTTQAIGVGACFVWSFGLGFIVLWVVNAISPVRVDEEDEIIGLNIAEHGAKSTLLDLASSMHRATTSHQFDESLKVEVENGTEVGDLASCFNQMVDASIEQQEKNSQLIRDVKQQNEKATQLLDELETRREHVAHTLDQFYEECIVANEQNGAETQSVLNSMMKQVQQLTEAVRTVQSILGRFAEPMQEITSQATNATEVAMNAQISSNDGKEKLENLVDATRNVSDILMMIENITRETNMVSLNAQVEAARAGEAGRGFSVVANHVGELASEAEGSTKEINKQVDSIQSETVNVVSSINNALGTLDELTSFSDTIHDSVQEMVARHDESQDQIHKIVDDADQVVSEVMSRIESIQKQSSEMMLHASAKFSDMKQQLTV